MDAETTNKVLIPKIIREKYPDLDETQVEELRQQVVVDSVVKNGEVRPVGDKRFIRMSGFVNIADINITDRLGQPVHSTPSRSITEPTATKRRTSPTRY